MKSLIYITISLFLFTSCENLLVKEIELEEINFESKLVVNSVLFNNTDTIELTLSENISVLEDPDYIIESIEGADIRLFEEEIEIGQFHKDENDSHYRLVLEEPLDGEGKSYRIELSHPDYPSAEATTSMPTKAEILELEFVENAGVSFDSRSLDGIKVKFADPIDEENYFLFSVNSEVTVIDTFIQLNGDTMIYEYQLYISAYSNDPLAESIGNRNYLSDFSFNGEEYSITILLDDGYSDRDMKDLLGSFKLNWTSASKEYYDFDRSLNRYYQNSGFGLFTEPVTIYSNVENGIGVFSSLNLQQIPF